MKITAILFLFLIFISCGRSAEEQQAQQKIDSLNTEIFKLKVANDTLSDHLLRKSYLTKVYPSYFDSIPNPEEHILKQLQQNRESIPKDAVLGGTMHFTDVIFISNELLVVTYEDGHILGKAAYSYTVTPTGELQFRMECNLR